MSGPTARALAGAIVLLGVSAGPAAAIPVDPPTGGAVPEAVGREPLVVAGSYGAPAPVVGRIACRAACAAAGVARPGAIVRIAGRRTEHVAEVLFLAGPGEADDTSAAPRRVTSSAVFVRVPRTAASGPLALALADGTRSAPSRTPLTVDGSDPLGPAGAIDAEVEGQKVFYDAARPAELAYVLGGTATATVHVTLVRAHDDVVIERWTQTGVLPGIPRRLTWNGTAGGHVQRDGVYRFRLEATPESAAAPAGAGEPPDVTPGGAGTAPGGAGTEPAAGGAPPTVTPGGAGSEVGTGADATAPSPADATADGAGTGAGAAARVPSGATPEGAGAGDSTGVIVGGAPAPGPDAATTGGEAIAAGARGRRARASSGSGAGGAADGDGRAAGGQPPAPAGQGDDDTDATDPDAGAPAEPGAHAPVVSDDAGSFTFQRHRFPIVGTHTFGTGAAAFGGGRGHQGQDVFAECGTPIVAARGGRVKVKQYESRAGNYVVIDGAATGVDYAYMHLRDEALVDIGDRVRTGQVIGFVGDTGDADGCHLHFEMWSGPGWYAGGAPFDPLPDLRAWDAES